MRPYYKLLTLIMLVSAIGFPQYWLIKQPVLFILFWTDLMVIVFTALLYLCRRCRHTACPVSRIQATE